MSRVKFRPQVTAVLDNEALQALADSTHHKHRKMLAVLEADARLRQGAMQLATPVAVRVEADVARSGPAVRWPGVAGVLDVELTGPVADRAMDLRRRAKVGSVVDATVAEAADRYATQGWASTIYTSDVTDLTALTSAAPNAARITVFRI